MPLPEKQGVGSSILPLATKVLATEYQNYTHFVLKLNSSGTFQWVNTYGGTSGDVGEGITVDSSGNPYITGWFYETVDFGGGNVTSAGVADIFVLKLNSSGAGIE